MEKTLINGVTLHVKFTRLPAFNIIIRKIAIIKIIKSACGITSIIIIIKARIGKMLEVTLITANYVNARV